MRVVGVSHPLGAPVASFVVEHGAHPRVTMFDAGFVPIRPLAAALHEGEILFTWLVREVLEADPRPAERHAVYVAPCAETPRRYQRIGAYALVLSERGVLGTVNSAATKAACGRCREAASTQVSRLRTRCCGRSSRRPARRSSSTGS